MYRRRLVKKLLIVAPLSILGVWEEEYQKFADFDYILAVLNGTGTKKTDTLRHLEGSPLQVAVINYESAWRLEKELADWLKKGDGTAICCDEGHKIKTHNTNASKALHRLGKLADYRLLLTGTVITNKALDVFSQYKFLNPAVFGNSFYSFRNRYFDMVGCGQHTPILKKSMEPELTRKIHSIAFRATKSECLDLPETTDIIRYVDLEPSAMKLYKNLVKDSFTELNGAEVTATNILTRLLRLSQLTGGFLSGDESHNFKNGLVISKMRNISGIGSTPAQKCEDMLMKCDYLNDKYGYNRIIHASGTPVSNSLSELYTTCMYLRPDLMRAIGIAQFDDWVTAFAKVNVQMEMSAGGGYKPKKRLNEFVNLPELMQIYHEFADVKNAEDLNLPVPELETGKNVTVVAKPSNFQLEYINSLAERSKAISTGTVNPRVDNMLKITHEARLLGLDERCIDPTRMPIPDGKVNICTDNLMKIYKETDEQKGVQAIFCDIAVNSTDGHFSVYENIKEELIKRGVPENEIAFASDADTPAKKTELIANLNNGDKRFIIASTSKFGTGANFQKKLTALHHLDIPWKPSDLTQREGRILRQGNTNEKVKIFNYVTEGTFDAYLMGIIVNKQKFISQLMSGKTAGRTCGDVSETVLNYAEIQALASGDPRVKEKIDLDVDVLRLKMLKNSFTEEKFRLQDVISWSNNAIKELREELEFAQADFETATITENPTITLNNRVFSERKDAGEALEILLAQAKNAKGVVDIGKIGDFNLKVEYFRPDFLSQEPSFSAVLSGKLDYSVELSENNPVGNISRLLNCYGHIPLKTGGIESKISRLQSDISSAETQLSEKFSHEDKLSVKQARLDELNKEFMVADDVIADTETVDKAENADVSAKSELPTEKNVKNTNLGL